MTIEGAIAQLQELIDNDGIPFWAKPSLQKVMETVEAERERHIEERKTMTHEEAIEILYRELGTETEDKLFPEVIEARDMAIESLKHIPCYLDSPCEYQNPDIKIPHTDCIVWHPYPSEKPTKEGTYLVTIKYENEEEACVLTSVFFSTYNCFSGGRFVTAWAELPKPYEEGA